MEGGGGIVERLGMVLESEVDGDKVLKIYTLRDALAGSCRMAPWGYVCGETGSGARNSVERSTDLVRGGVAAS